MKNNITNVMIEYIPNEDIFSEDDESIYQLKKAVEALPQADKIIFVMYCETGSLRKVGKELGVSHTIIYKEITRIKKQIYDYIKTNYNNNNSVLLDRFKRCYNIA